MYDRSLLAIFSIITIVSSRDLILGSNNNGKKIFDEKHDASPAIWRQVENITINTSYNEVISKVVVTDLRPEKDGDVKIVDGGEGQKTVTIELKSPTVLRGYDFHIEVYSSLDKNHDDDIDKNRPVHPSGTRTERTLGGISDRTTFKVGDQTTQDVTTNKNIPIPASISQDGKKVDDTISNSNPDILPTLHQPESGNNPQTTVEKRENISRLHDSVKHLDAGDVKSRVIRDTQDQIKTEKLTEPPSTSLSNDKTIPRYIPLNTEKDNREPPSDSSTTKSSGLIANGEIENNFDNLRELSVIPLNVGKSNEHKTTSSIPFTPRPVRGTEIKDKQITNSPNFHIGDTPSTSSTTEPVLELTNTPVIRNSFPDITPQSKSENNELRSSLIYNNKPTKNFENPSISSTTTVPRNVRDTENDGMIPMSTKDKTPERPIVSTLPPNPQTQSPISVLEYSTTKSTASSTAKINEMESDENLHNVPRLISGGNTNKSNNQATF